MESIHRAPMLICGALAVWLPAVPLGAQSRNTPEARHIKASEPISGYDAVVGITVQAPRHVNRPPNCVRLKIVCESQRRMSDFGFAAALAAPVAGPFAIVGEASAWANTWAMDGTREGRRVNWVRAALVGLRWQSRPAAGTNLARGRFFLQILTGPQWNSVMPSRRAIQPGGGVDIRVDDRMIVRFQADYIHVAGGARDVSTGRVPAGFVFPR